MKDMRNVRYFVTVNEGSVGCYPISNEFQEIILFKNKKDAIRAGEGDYQGKNYGYTIFEVNENFIRVSSRKMR